LVPHLTPPHLSHCKCNGPLSSPALRERTLLALDAASRLRLSADGLGNMGMSTFFQNRFVNWVLAFNCMLWAFGSVPSANAQEADPRITGSCTPRTQDQGPWDCKVNKWIEAQCQTNKSTGYDDVWKPVRNADEASELLKTMYLKLGGPIKFSQWLACQGFSPINFFSPQVQFPSSRDSGISVHMQITYSPQKSPFSATWSAYFFANQADFLIDIDNFGQIKKIEQSYSYE